MVFAFLNYITQDESIQFHPCCCKWHYFVLFYGWIVFHFVYTTLYTTFLVQSSVDRYLCCFHVLTIVNRAARKATSHIARPFLSFCGGFYCVSHSFRDWLISSTNVSETVLAVGKLGFPRNKVYIFFEMYTLNIWCQKKKKMKEIHGNNLLSQKEMLNRSVCIHMGVCLHISSFKIPHWCTH